MTVVQEVGRSLVLRPTTPVVTTSSQLAELVEHYLQQDSFVIDVETMGDHRGDPRRNEIAWVGLATKGRTDVIPIGHPNGELVEVRKAVLGSGVKRLAEGKALRKSDVSKSLGTATKVFSDPPAQLTPAEVFSALEPLLFSDTITKVAHNASFDLGSVAKYYRDRVPSLPYGDTMIAEMVLDSRKQFDLSLASCLKRHLGFEMEKGVGKCIEDHSFEEVAHYLYLDCRMTWLLWRKLSAMVERTKMAKIFGLEMDALNCLIHMEGGGVLIDTETMREMRTRLEEVEKNATAAAYRAAGRAFNVNSNPEKQKLLYTSEGRNLEPKSFTKTGGPSTAAEALSMYPRDPLAKSLLELAEVKKLLSTYITPYLGGEVERTTNGKTRVEFKESLLYKGRVHTRFKQTGAATGRLASQNPNLQNVPSRGSLAKEIRNMFVADPGHVFVVADYSQIEPRIAASLSMDPTMLSAYEEGRDLYQAIADQLGVDRAAGKKLILSMSYGVGPQKIADDLGIGVNKARKLLDDFSKNFPDLVRCKKDVESFAMSRRPVPYSVTVLGRRRYIPELMSKDEALRARGKRQAFNHVIQGTAAEIMKIALVRTHRMLPDGSKMLLTVHDEIVTLAPEGLVDDTVEAVRESMEGFQLPKIVVPMKADISVVTKWGDAK